MSEKDKSPAADAEPALGWAKLWQTMAEILEPHGRGVVGFDGTVHVGASVREAGRFWRWQ